MTRGKIDLTVDDIIATLKNSSLPNIITEGSDDVIILRRLEDILIDDFVSVFPVGGQGKVLKLFDRSAELGAQARLAFVADRDCMVFEETPDVYQDRRLTFTDGYSIENDAIRDGNFIALMSNEERSKFNLELDLIMKWFALEASKSLAGEPGQLKTHPDTLLEDAGLEAAVNAALDQNHAAQQLLGTLRSEPYRYLRGKTLLNLMMRQLSYPGRAARHRHNALLDQVGAQPGDLISTLFDGVKEALRPSA